MRSSFSVTRGASRLGHLGISMKNISVCEHPVLFSSIFRGAELLKNLNQVYVKSKDLSSVIRIKDLLCHGNGRGTAGAAVFGDDRDHNIRVIHIGKSDKPGMCSGNAVADVFG